MATTIDKTLNCQTLTPQIKMLISVIGMTQTCKFLTAFGGRRINLPKHIVDFTHPLALVLGLDDANKLCHYWSQTHQLNMRDEFDVPVLDTFLLQLRIKLICTDYQTLSINELVNKYKMSRSYIQRFTNNHCRYNNQDSVTKFTKIYYQADLFSLVSVQTKRLKTQK